MAFRGRGMGSGMLTAENYYSGYAELGLGADTYQERVETYHKDMTIWEARRAKIEEEFKKDNLTATQYQTALKALYLEKPSAPAPDEDVTFKDIASWVTAVGSSASDMYKAHADYQIELKKMKERNPAGGPMDYTPTYMQTGITKDSLLPEAPEWAVPAVIAGAGIITLLAIFYYWR